MKMKGFCLYVWSWQLAAGRLPDRRLSSAASWAWRLPELASIHSPIPAWLNVSGLLSILLLLGGSKCSPLVARFGSPKG